MESKLRNLIVRAISGVFLVAIVLGAIIYSRWGYGLLLMAIAVGGVNEFYKMAKAKGIVAQSVLGCAAAAAIYGFGFDYFYNGSQMNLNIALFLMLIIPLMFVVELFRGGDRPLADLGTTILALIYVAVPMAMLAGVPLLLTGGEWNPIVMVLYMIIIWSNDTFAYLVGVQFGRHRLNERISPKKSWEGFYGGVIGAIAISLLGAYLIDGDYVVWGGIGLITAVMGCIGDLVESMFKRTCGVKDSGSIIPGHGGWLDRFDGLIFSAPFVFVYLIFLELI